MASSSLSLISSLPTCISPEEHRERTAETPTSFADIPPILRHREENVTAVFDPPLEGLSQTDGEDPNGTLYIIESALVFMLPSGHGFQVTYPAIILHAISRTVPGQHIYCQLDETIGDENTEEEKASEMRELKLIPQNSDSVDVMFTALSACAELHPDPTNGSDDEMELSDDADEAFIDANEDADDDLSEAGRATRDRLEAMLESAVGPTGHPKTNGLHADEEEGVERSQSPNDEG